MSLPSSADSREIRTRHFAGLFLLSLATLLLELTLTRVLSESLWYHLGFLVISTALLGFGASGVTFAGGYPIFHKRLCEELMTSKR